MIFLTFEADLLDITTLPCITLLLPFCQSVTFLRLLHNVLTLQTIIAKANVINTHKNCIFDCY